MRQKQFNLGQMHHLAIMRKSWGLINKILKGEKTVESRWYKTKKDPWDKIRPGDFVYFKDAGKPVSVRAKVSKVLQFTELTPAKTQEILRKYGRADLGIGPIMPEIRKYLASKNYCILIFFKDVKEIESFEVNKTGYGTMAAWISVDNIKKIKK